MPGKQVEQHLRKAGLRAALEDDLVVRQHRLEPAAQGVALHQHGGVHAALRRVLSHHTRSMQRRPYSFSESRSRARTSSTNSARSPPKLKTPCTSDAMHEVAAPAPGWRGCR